MEGTLIQRAMLTKYHGRHKMQLLLVEVMLVFICRLLLRNCGLGLILLSAIDDYMHTRADTSVHSVCIEHVAQYAD